MKVVIVGGVAGGMSAATMLLRGAGRDTANLDGGYLTWADATNPG